MSSIPRGSGLSATVRANAPSLPRDRIAWLLGFAFLAFVAGRPELTPVVPGTELALLWLPFAFLAIVLLVRPANEAPFYAAIYALVSLTARDHSDHLPFAAIRVGLEITQVFALVYLFHPRFRHFLNFPQKIPLYIGGVLAILAAGAGAAVLAAQLPGVDGSVLGEEMAAQPALAWRHWWLGNACAYLTVTGPVVYLMATRGAIPSELRQSESGRRQLAILAACLFVTAFLFLPAYELPLPHLPPDVHLAMMLMPAPIAFAMAARYRGLGTAVALLVLTPLVMMSIGGPHSTHHHWSHLPPMATPLHVYLIIIAVGCLVIAAINHRLRRATIKALEAAQARSRFVAMMNHELRTPLNAILGFTELMQLQNQRELGRAIAPIENIHASGQRLLAMIEGLLGQADHGANAFDLSKEPVELGTTLVQAVNDVQARCQGLGCSVRLAANQNLTIDADPRALKQILFVLLSYPLRYVGPDTTIAVSAEEAGTDTIVEIHASGLVNAAADERDKLEQQLVQALALAHGARLHTVRSGTTSRLTRLTFFATRAAAEA